MKNIVKVKNIEIGKGLPKVCAPLVGKTLVELLEEANYLKGLPLDLVEWRVDFYEGSSDINMVKTALKEIRKALLDIPIIFTFRSLKEGGQREITTEYYVELNKEIIGSKLVDMVDVELFNEKQHIEDLVCVAKESGVAIVLSTHDFQKTPAKNDILDRFQSAINLGANIFKIAVMPNSTEDVITLLDVTRIMKETYKNIPIITIAMGTLGIISRISGEVFGSDVTFGAGKNSSAPGQISVEDLRRIINTIHKYNF